MPVSPHCSTHMLRLLSKIMAERIGYSAKVDDSPTVYKPQANQQEQKWPISSS